MAFYRTKIYRIKPNTRYIHPTLNGAEICQLTQKHEQQLQVVEMDFCRKSGGIARLDKIRNNKIREIMKREDEILDEKERNSQGRRELNCRLSRNMFLPPFFLNINIRKKFNIFYIDKNIFKL